MTPSQKINIKTKKINFFDPSEYNLEFQGNIWNLRKRALLWRFTQKCLQIILLLAKRAHFLSNITKGIIRLLDGDFFWIIPCLYISFETFSLAAARHLLCDFTFLASHKKNAPSILHKKLPLTLLMNFTSRPPGSFSK